jgi:hypothetical protein
MVSDGGGHAEPALEVALGGETEFGLTAIEGDRIRDTDRNLAFFMDIEIAIEAEGGLDNGLVYGSEVELEFDDGPAEVDEAVLFLSGGFGRIELGLEDGAEDVMFLGGHTVAAGTGGIDGDAENLGKVKVTDSGDAAKASYFTPRLFGLQLGLSLTPDTGDDDDDIENHVGVGVNYLMSVGETELGLAAVSSFGDAEDPDDEELSSIAFGGIAEINDLAFGAGYGKDDDQGDRLEFATFGIGYDYGPGDVSVGYNLVDSEEDGDMHVFALSADYLLFPGVVLKGDAVYNATQGAADTIAQVVTVELNYRSVKGVRCSRTFIRPRIEDHFGGIGCLGVLPGEIADRGQPV